MSRARGLPGESPGLNPARDAAVTFLLRRFATVTAGAGIPAATPIHVTGTGWPTGDGRTESAQARVVAAVAGAVIASDAGVTACEWFGLRDSLTAAPFTARFGLLRDDYAPKPAFAVVGELISRHGAPTPAASPGRERRA